MGGRLSGSVYAWKRVGGSHTMSATEKFATEAKKAANRVDMVKSTSFSPNFLAIDPTS